jgi:hypothetical protein
MFTIKAKEKRYNQKRLNLEPIFFRVVKIHSFDRLLVDSDRLLFYFDYNNPNQ